ncbi:unnamed protein product, partial [marine sediment metagenome]
RYLNQSLEELPSRERFLEIGCGNGFFLKQAKQTFRKVYGVEPSKESVESADPEIKKLIINDIFKKNQFKKNFFDLIVLFQVIDHLPYPNELLKECFKILKPGGCVLSINHNVSSLSARLLGESSPIFDIEHTYLYDKNTLSKLFKNNSYQIIGVFDVANFYPLSYWLRMFPLSKKLKELVFRVTEILKISGFRFWLNAGNIG